jgi:hypothetical protein
MKPQVRPGSAGESPTCVPALAGPPAASRWGSRFAAGGELGLRANGLQVAAGLFDLVSGGGELGVGPGSGRGRVGAVLGELLGELVDAGTGGGVGGLLVSEVLGGAGGVGGVQVGVQLLDAMIGEGDAA